MGFVGSYQWKIRQVWGSQPLLVTGIGAFLINSQGQLLLGKRTDRDEWCFVGGSVELGDTVTGTLKKEIEEETGLIVNDYRFVGIVSNPHETTINYPQGDIAVVINVLFEVHVGEAEPRVDEEHSVFGWFDLENLPEPFAPAGVSAMNAYKKFRQTGQTTIE